MVALLLEEGCDPHAKAQDDMSALHFAAGNGYADVCKELCKNGVRVNVKDTKKLNTPLHAAAAKGHAACVEYLLKKNADALARNKANKTPVDVAAGAVRDVLLAHVRARKGEAAEKSAASGEAPPQKEKKEREAEALPAAGAILRGKVVTTKPFGAFCSLDGLKSQNLIHISQLAPERVNATEDIVQVGADVWVKVLSVEAGGGSLAARGLPCMRPSTRRRARSAPPAATASSRRRARGGGGRAGRRRRRPRKRRRRRSTASPPPPPRRPACRPAPAAARRRRRPPPPPPGCRRRARRRPPACRRAAPGGRRRAAASPAGRERAAAAATLGGGLPPRPAGDGAARPKKKLKKGPPLPSHLLADDDDAGDPDVEGS